MKQNKNTNNKRKLLEMKQENLSIRAGKHWDCLPERKQKTQDRKCHCVGGINLPSSRENVQCMGTTAYNNVSGHRSFSLGHLFFSLVLVEHILWQLPDNGKQSFESVCAWNGFILPYSLNESLDIILQLNLPHPHITLSKFQMLSPQKIKCLTLWHVNSFDSIMSHCTYK
jgi:hypothetical protein